MYMQHPQTLQIADVDEQSFDLVYKPRGWEAYSGPIPGEQEPTATQRRPPARQQRPGRPRPAQVSDKPARTRKASTDTPTPEEPTS